MHQPAGEKTTTLPLEIELGRLEIEARDFFQARAGESLEFEMPPPFEVTMRCGGRIWATGRLAFEASGGARLEISEIFDAGAGNFSSARAIPLMNRADPPSGEAAVTTGGKANER